MQVTILVGLFILFSVYQLVMHLRQGTLRQHPLFAFTEEAAAAEGQYWAMQETQQQIFYTHANRRPALLLLPREAVGRVYVHNDIACMQAACEVCQLLGACVCL